MGFVAEILKAPSGTEYRTADDQPWQTASVGTKFEFGYQIRNTQSNDYELELYSEAAIQFTSASTVTLNDVSGTVKYKNAQGQWVDVNSDGTVSAEMVKTGPGGGVVVVCSHKGVVPPPPWP
jgi:hypothetical protein